MFQLISSGDCYRIQTENRDVGSFSLHENTFHNRHLYLKLNMKNYDYANGQALISQIRELAERPLQVMAYADDPICVFGEACGFCRLRKCF